jgi:hypothetical protein
MSEWDDETLAKWLDAEKAGAPEEADRLFTTLAAVHLSRLYPSAGLADRVLAALPAGSLASRRPVFDPASSWWVRLTALAAVGLLGLGLALVSPGHVFAVAVGTVSVTARLLDGIVASLGVAVGLWTASLDLLAVLGEAAGHVATTGVMPLLIVANLAVASAAFVGLRRLLPPREECV